MGKRKKRCYLVTVYAGICELFAIAAWKSRLRKILLPDALVRHCCQCQSMQSIAVQPGAELWPEDKCAWSRRREDCRECFVSLLLADRFIDRIIIKWQVCLPTVVVSLLLAADNQMTEDKCFCSRRRGGVPRVKDVLYLCCICSGWTLFLYL